MILLLSLFFAQAQAETLVLTKDGTYEVAERVDDYCTESGSGKNKKYTLHRTTALKVAYYTTRTLYKVDAFQMSTCELAKNLEVGSRQNTLKFMVQELLENGGPFKPTRDNPAYAPKGSKQWHEDQVAIPYSIVVDYDIESAEIKNFYYQEN